VKLLAIPAVLAVVLAVALVLGHDRRGPLVVSGFVEADEIRVGSRVGGRVARVHVEEGQTVLAGELLVELELFDLAERRAEAGAELAARRAEHARLAAGFRSEEIGQARARVRQLEARLERLVKGPREQEIEAGRAELALADAELELARLELERALSLRAEQIASEDTLDRAQRSQKVAEATVEVRRQELHLLEEGSRAEDVEGARAELAEAEEALRLYETGSRVEDVARAEAAVQAAEAARNAIDRRIDELSIRAPQDGVVEAIDLRPGDLVPPDAPVLALVDPARLWVRAYVPENRLALELGQEVAVGVDSFPDERFRARIGFISRAAEFTPRNVQTPEERSKQVFRIKVFLEEGLDRLRPGMNADVWLEGRP
jgi:multidrug resistance efflux pump